MTNPTTSTVSPTTSSAVKRPKRHHNQEEHHQSLLPGLPDHIAQLSLTSVHPSTLYSVCRSWRRLIYSPSFPPFLSLYALLLSTQITSQQSIHFSSFDPVSSSWLPLPPLPDDPPLRFIFQHPSFISRRLSVQSVSVAGNLVVLAATAEHFLPALPRPLVFNPVLKKWSYGPPLATPRRWCAAGASRGVVYVASGIGTHYSTEVARSVEKWDLNNNTKNNAINGSGVNCCNSQRLRNNSFESGWKWEKMRGLRDGKFSRDAIDAVGWRGKLCMVNVKGDAAKEGIIYDVQSDTWVEMPDGMLAGWRGPAASMDEEFIYVVDESRGVLKRYDSDRMTWVELVEDEMLKGAQQIVAAGGRVCVLSGSGVSIAVVDVVAQPPRVWVIDTPVGFQAVSIHALPRMSRLPK